MKEAERALGPGVLELIPHLEAQAQWMGRRGDCRERLAAPEKYEGVSVFVSSVQGLKKDEVSETKSMQKSA